MKGGRPEAREGQAMYTCKVIVRITCSVVEEISSVGGMIGDGGWQWRMHHEECDDDARIIY